MRIAVVSSFPPTIGGIADYGKHVARHLAADPRVEDVTVLADQAPGAPRNQHIAGVRVLRVWRRDGAGTGPALLRALTTLRPDVVWFNLGLTMFGTRPIAAASGLTAPLSTTVLGYRTVVTLHELPALANLAALGLRTAAARFGAAVVPRLVLSADTIVVTLDRYRRFLVERYGAGNIRRIPLGADGPPDCPGEPEQETVLVFGTFGPHKQPGLVAEAVAKVRRTRPGLRLVVAGTDHPRYPGFMTAYCARHGLTDSWVGYVPVERLGALFSNATVVVVPSMASTGSSGVIYRAISHGRVVLASDLLDFRGLALDEDLKLAWFAPGDPVSLAGSLDALLRDPEQRRMVTRHNLETAKRLGPTRIVDAYLAAFDDRHQDTVAARELVAGSLAPALPAVGEA